ncbi:hypothetical protein HPB51_025003 [Rhipicephalus microplus]|uniref:Adenylate cyclase n=1 Tax=Rhipicephalus microplus TaxID=6941 RepID=A0A9J6EQL7_RHIMP|nr:hypothetical protein HPB51_025003 [Rhipicephalus microplus]
MALQSWYTGGQDVAYTDAVAYESKAAHTAVKVTEDSSLMVCCTVRSVEPVEAEEVAIALAISQKGVRVVISDSKNTVRNYELGRVMETVVRIINMVGVPKELVLLTWAPAHQGLRGNEEAHLVIRGLTYWYANLHNLVLFLIQFVPAGLLSIFVSPWSDRYGHKIPLLVATSGGILQDLTTLFSVMYTSVPLYATVLCAIPNGFSGGLVSVCASVYSNGTRTATAELKTVRFACIMTALTLGFQLGLFVGGQVFRAAGGNYTAIYVTSAILLAVMFVWIGWTVPFSNQLHRTSRRELVRDLIRLDNLREGGQAVFRQRPGYNRAKLLLLMISIWFILFNSEVSAFFYS